MPGRRYALAIFDLDGVLIDSRANMAAAWQAVRRRCGYDTPFEAYFARIGLPFRDILRSLGIRERLEEAEAEYARASIAHFDLIRVYAGVPRALSSLRAAGLACAIVTSKDALRTSLAIERIGAVFDAVQPPAQDLRGKPAPDQLLAAATQAGVDPAAAVYVGDMPVDGQSARNAGMDYAHAGWGYGSAPPDARICAEAPAALARFLVGRSVAATAEA